MSHPLKCKCGKESQLNTYFRKGSTLRVTVCNDCAMFFGFKETDDNMNPIYDSIPYEKLSKKNQVKLPPNNAS